MELLRVCRRMIGPRHIAAIVCVLFPSQAQADVREVTLGNLATRSDLIVVARVVAVQDAPKEGQEAGSDLGPLRVARAQVIENWKGATVREVQFVASPTWMCDTSSAEVGELVVLFLEKTKGSEYLSIAHAGRGRMPLRVVGSKMYARLSEDVILPDGTPTRAEKKIVHLTLPSGDPKKPGTSLALPYTEESIELEVLRRLVKSSGR